MDDMSVLELADLLLATQRERRLEGKRAAYARRCADPEQREAIRAQGKAAQAKAREQGKKPNRDWQKRRLKTDAEYRAQLNAKRSRYAKKVRSDPERRRKQYGAAKARRERIHSSPHGRCKTTARTYGVPAEALMQILVLQRFRCAVTGLPLNFSCQHRDPLQPTIDHILPQARGGTNDPENLRWVIWAVNYVRTDKAHDDLLGELIRPSDALRARLEASAPDYVREAR